MVRKETVHYGLSKLKKKKKKKTLIPDATSTDTCIVNANYERTCFRDLGMGTFDSGNQQCQALGGHLPIFNTSIVTSFLSIKYGNIWMSIKANRYATWAIHSKYLSF